MLLRCLRSELQKCRRSPVWLAFLVLPIFPAILGTGNYLGNLEALENGWYSLWSQHTLFSSMFFLPALLGVFCAWQWRLEHTDHNWNSFLTAPVPVRDLYGAKLILAAVVSLLAQVCIGVLFLLSGKIAGISGPVPPELPEWLLCGALGGISVCAVQLFFSLVIRAFAPPVAFGLVGGILGLMFTAQGWGYAFPYSLLCLGMRANTPQMELDLKPFVLSALVYTVVFAFLSLRYLQRRDAAAE
ncbi:ABC transporter permease [bacterium 210917-SL.2.15]|nr:ABC transporter permease [bacterium 210917-SL.2.15]